jgi:hypothetical protein
MFKTLMNRSPDWQAHYYAQLQLLACSREVLLMQSVFNLFGYQKKIATYELMKCLEQDLTQSLSPHTLYQRKLYEPGGVEVHFYPQLVAEEIFNFWQIQTRVNPGVCQPDLKVLNS